MRHEIRSRCETITPAKAKKMLRAAMESDAYKNRRIRPKTLKRYVQQIRDGKWVVTGEPIVFNGSGTLLNGQHRLSACVEADTPFDTIVVRGVDSDAWMKMDTGASRTAGDVVHAAGHKYANALASAARIAMAIDRIESGTNLSVVSWAHWVSHEDTLKFVEENSDLLIECMSVVASVDAKFLLRPSSLFLALYYQFSVRNMTRADEFFEMLIGGENLTKTHPVYKLRQLLISTATQDRKHLKRSAPWKAMITVKAWNAWMRNAEIKHLRVTDKEKWPGIVSRRTG